MNLFVKKRSSIKKFFLCNIQRLRRVDPDNRTYLIGRSKNSQKIPRSSRKSKNLFQIENQHLADSDANVRGYLIWRYKKICSS